MNIQNKFLLLILIFISLQVESSDSTDTSDLIWVGFNKSAYNYLESSNSAISASGNSIGISHQLSTQWFVSASYSKENASGQWLEEKILFEQIYKGAETSSKALGFGIDWQADDYTLSFSYSDMNNEEYATTFLPRETEIIKGEDQIFSFSYSKFSDLRNWSISWQAGLQYAANSTESNLIKTNDVITLTNTQQEQENWNGYIDLGFSHLVQQESFDWTAQLNFGWSEELSKNEKQKIAIIRNGERRIATRISALSSNNFRLPNSGYWQLSAAFDWSKQWNASVGYSETISAETNVNYFSFDLSYSF